MEMPKELVWQGGSLGIFRHGLGGVPAKRLWCTRCNHEVFVRIVGNETRPVLICMCTARMGKNWGGFDPPWTMPATPAMPTISSGTTVAVAVDAEKKVAVVEKPILEGAFQYTTPPTEPERHKDRSMHSQKPTPPAPETLKP